MGKSDKNPTLISIAIGTLGISFLGGVSFLNINIPININLNSTAATSMMKTEKSPTTTHNASLPNTPQSTPTRGIDKKLKSLMIVIPNDGTDELDSVFQTIEEQSGISVSVYKKSLSNYLEYIGVAIAANENAIFIGQFDEDFLNSCKNRGSGFSVGGLNDEYSYIIYQYESDFESINEIIKEIKKEIN